MVKRVELQFIHLLLAVPLLYFMSFEWPGLPLTMYVSLVGFRTYSSKSTVNLDYLSYLRDALVQPLISQGVEGVPEVVSLMDMYYLMKEDFESIMELSSWGGNPSPFSKLDPKVSGGAICDSLEVF